MSEPAERTVLVIDDEPTIAELYSELLADEYDVRTANDGAKALELMDEAVDVALLDRRMPGMSGDEVLEAIRQEGYDCRVAMLTAVEPAGDIIDMAFDDYLVKPVDQSDLLGLVEVLLERSTYDEKSREYFRLASKKAALEIAGNDGTAEYRELLDRLESVREEIDESLDKVGAEQAFRELSSNTPSY